MVHLIPKRNRGTKTISAIAVETMELSRRWTSIFYADFFSQPERVFRGAATGNALLVANIVIRL
ncbi:MAG TPA: hypothetical protein VFV92_11295 [Candidatus Bathyarchaeia archaeon]|nr:hypothetical protein [Candidatus Bathyarchaeia archaeon]